MVCPICNCTESFEKAHPLEGVIEENGKRIIMSGKVTAIMEDGVPPFNNLLTVSILPKNVLCGMINEK